ncbi:hypothetical protein FS749_009598, partial [Ceratobasidium sp. UAMH 11750]
MQVALDTPFGPSAKPESAHGLRFAGIFVDGARDSLPGHGLAKLVYLRYRQDWRPLSPLSARAMVSRLGTLRLLTSLSLAFSLSFT